MYQLEPILGETTSSYFYPQHSIEPTIPDGIVRRRRQIFVDKLENEPINGNLHIFETPTTSSDELHSLAHSHHHSNSNTLSLHKAYPITRITTSDSFSPPKSRKNVAELSPQNDRKAAEVNAQIRVLPPPSYAQIYNVREWEKNKVLSTPQKRERLDIVRFGITAPSDMLRDGPIWVNSGPPSSNSQPPQDTVHVAKFWRPTSDDDSPPSTTNHRHKRHIVTRLDRTPNSNRLPSLTINVSSTHEGKERGDGSCAISGGTQHTDNDGWSCRTDWRYYETGSPAAPRISEVNRIQKNQKKRHSMGVDMNLNKSSNLDNVSLASSRRTSDGQESVASDSSQIMSMHEQIVRYSANTSNPSYSNQNVEDAIMSERETSLVVRLERELTEAQNCNHRLNQQLKTLANSSNGVIKKELSETKKQLKDRADEAEVLRRQLAKSEGERSMWMSKTPQDVNTLIAEKKELRKQLDREQSEKQDLFMQINSMIAQLADAGDQNEVNRLKVEISSLKRELEAEKISSSAESSRLNSEILKARREMDGFVQNGDNEKDQMEREIEGLQRQLDIKEASLQSLRLAKSDNSKFDKVNDENERLKLETDDLRRKIAHLTNENIEKHSEIIRLRDASSVNDVAKHKTEELQERLQGFERQLREEQSQKERLRSQTEELKTALSSSEDALSRLKTKISQFEQDAGYLKEENHRLQQINTASSSATSSQLMDLSHQLKEQVDRNQILEATLKEKDGKIDKVKVELLAAESRAQQAEAELKKMETRAQTSERKEQQLEAQLRAQGDSNEQMVLLSGELAKSEERHQLAVSRLQKAEAQLKEKETEYRQRSDSLESAIGETTKLQNQLEALRNEKSEIARESNETIQKLKSEISQIELNSKNMEETINKLNNTIKQLNEDKRRIETDSKSSVADEITTLMSSLNSVRQENSQYEEEVRGLQNDIRSLRDELYHQQDECSQWKMAAEKAETDVEHHVQKVQLLQSTQQNSSSRLETENKRLEETVEKMREDKDSARREHSDAISKMKAELTEITISSEREIRETQEKLERVERELEMSKRRVEQLQDDQCKYIGSQDEMKTELLKEVREKQNKAEELALELAGLKSKNTSLISELDHSNTSLKELKERLQTIENKYEETLEELKNSEELTHRLKESHILSGNMETKFGEMQSENKKRMDSMIEDHKKEMGNLRDELRKANTEHASLEAVMEEQQKELVKHREETDALQDQIRAKNMDTSKVDELERNLDLHKRQSDENSRKVSEIENKLVEANRTNDSLISNVQEMTRLLQSESKRLEEVTSEKRALEEQVAAGGSKDERVAELTAENARLAGELLRSHSSADKALQSEKEQITRKFEERFKNVNLEKTHLASDLQAAQAKQRSLELKIEEQERRRRGDLEQLEILRGEINQCRGDYEKLQQNGPVAPPRSTRTISNMSNMTNWTQADFSECEDLTKLRTEIDKQKRLIIVLRRKLQGLKQ